MGRRHVGIRAAIFLSQKFFTMAQTRVVQVTVASVGVAAPTLNDFVTHNTALTAAMNGILAAPPVGYSPNSIVPSKEPTLVMTFISDGVAAPGAAAIVSWTLFQSFQYLVVN